MRTRESVERFRSESKDRKFSRRFSGSNLEEATSGYGEDL
jgi:hypothetical protein